MLNYCQTYLGFSVDDDRHGQRLWWQLLCMVFPKEGRYGRKCLSWLKGRVTLGPAYIEAGLFSFLLFFNQLKTFDFDHLNPTS